MSKTISSDYAKKYLRDITKGGVFDFYVEEGGKKYNLAPVFAFLIPQVTTIVDRTKLYELADAKMLGCILNRIEEEHFKSSNIPNIDCSKEVLFDKFVAVSDLFLKENLENKMYENAVVISELSDIFLGDKSNICEKATSLRALCEMVLHNSENRLGNNVFSVVFSFMEKASCLYKTKDKPHEVIKKITLSKDLNALVWLGVCSSVVFRRKYGYDVGVSDSFVEMLGKFDFDYSVVLDKLSYGRVFEVLDATDMETKDYYSMSYMLKTTHRLTTLSAVLGVAFEGIRSLSGDLGRERNIFNDEKRVLLKDNTKYKKRMEKIEAELVNKNREIDKIKSDIDSGKDKLISDLRDKFNSAERDNKVLSSKLISATTRIENLEERENSRVREDSRVEDLEREIGNLNAVISAYEDIVEDTPNVSREVILDTIRGKRLLFVGGPVGMDRKLSKVTDNFSFIDIKKHSGSFIVPENTDLIIVNCRIMKHSYTERAEKMARQFNIPMLTTGVTNVDMLIRKIYTELIS